MAGAEPTEPVAQRPTEKESRSRTRLYVVLGVIGLLLVALIVLLALVLRGLGETTSAEPTASSTTSTVASPTPEATDPLSVPSATPEQTDAMPSSTATGPRFTSFDAPATEGGCSLGGPSFNPTRPLVRVSWTTAGAETAWFVSGTSDAADSGYMEIPVDGSHSDFQFEQEFGCGSDSSTYTITLVGGDGSHVSRNWTVQNTGDVFS